MLTQEHLKSLLHYDPETGIFTNRVARSKRSKIGAIAGSKEKTGYTRIIIGYKRYRAHRLAWLYMTGKMPEKMIDHKNGIKSDDRFCNLRQAIMSENKFNQGKQLNNISGHKGVSLHIQTGRWRARGNKGGKEFHLGLFKSKDDAIAAYKKFAIENHNEFLNLK